MAGLITHSDNNEIYIRSGKYSIFATKARPETVPLAPLVATPLAHLKAAIASKNEASDAVLEGMAHRNARLSDFTDQVVPFGLKVAAHFGSRTAPGFQRIFTESPSKLANTPGIRRAARFAEFWAAMDSALTPKPVQEDAKPLRAAYEAYVHAEAMYQATLQPEADAVTGLKAARSAMMIGMSKLKSQLGDLYPLQTKKVDSFFLEIQRGKAKKSASLP